MPVEKIIYEYFLSKYKGFTEIQKVALPVVESGKNCLITAPTGTGKTEAAILPILEKIRKEGGEGIIAIYVTPLRSLNRDLMKRLEDICSKFGISVGVRHGDTPQKERGLQTRKPPQLLITTPETLQNILITKPLRNSLKNLRYLIVDELHELYYNKRGAQLSIALERIVEVAGEFQRIGISATIGDPTEAASFLFGDREYEIIKSEEEKKMLINVEFPQEPVFAYKELKEKFSLDKDSAARIEKVISLIKEYNKSIVFVNTRQVAESIGSKIIFLSNIYNFGTVAIHHSSLDKEERIKVEDSFKNGAIKAIIATSSLELGIDIGDVDLVIQYGSPKQVTRLIQRVGRSGHGVKGHANGRIIVGSILDSIESACIAKLAEEKKLEKNKIEESPADVLANQIIAIALEYNSIEKNKIFNIVKRARPFKKISNEVFEGVLKILDEQKLIKIKERAVLRSARTLEYFIDNISVIPDVSRFIVKNVTTNRVISSLDERFVANYIDEGTDFIAKGLPWHVVSIEKGVIYVEPSASVEAAVPDWEGEDIPVSFEVATEVKKVFEEKRTDEISHFIDKQLEKKIKDFFDKQEKFFTLKNNKIAVEVFDEYVIIYTLLGKLANEFLGKVIGSIFTADVGGISVRTTPYAIILDLSMAKRRANIERDLNMIKEYNIERFLEKSGAIAKSELFRYKFTQTAKLFGIIEKNSVLTKNTVDRLIQLYKETVVYNETIRDLYKNYYDVAHVEEFLKKLRKGDINFEFYEFNELSLLANEILKSSYYYKELILPTPPRSDELRQFIEGMENKRIELMCTFCGFRFSKNLYEIKEDEKLKCPSCGSSMVSVYKEEYAEVLEKIKRGAEISDKEKEYYKECIMAADLVNEYGKRALVALSTYGIGAKTAAKVLKMLRKEYKYFIIDLIEAQKNYIRYRKFWKE